MPRKRATTPAPALTEPAPAPTHTFVAMAPHAWGRGDTIAEAVKNARRNVPGIYVKGPTYKVFVYRVLGFDGVTGMGYIKAKATPELIATRTVRRPRD